MSKPNPFADQNINYYQQNPNNFHQNYSGPSNCVPQNFQGPNALNNLAGQFFPGQFTSNFQNLQQIPGNYNNPSMYCQNYQQGFPNHTGNFPIAQNPISTSGQYYSGMQNYGNGFSAPPSNYPNNIPLQFDPALNYPNNIPPQFDPALNYHNNIPQPVPSSNYPNNFLAQTGNFMRTGTQGYYPPVSARENIIPMNSNPQVSPYVNNEKNLSSGLVNSNTKTPPEKDWEKNQNSIKESENKLSQFNLKEKNLIDLEEKKAPTSNTSTNLKNYKNEETPKQETKIISRDIKPELKKLKSEENEDLDYESNTIIIPSLECTDTKVEAKKSNNLRKGSIEKKPELISNKSSVSFKQGFNKVTETEEFQPIKKNNEFLPKYESQALKNVIPRYEFSVKKEMTESVKTNIPSTESKAKLEIPNLSTSKNLQLEEKKVPISTNINIKAEIVSKPGNPITVPDIVPKPNIDESKSSKDVIIGVNQISIPSSDTSEKRRHPIGSDFNRKGYESIIKVVQEKIPSVYLSIESAGNNQDSFSLQGTKYDLDKGIRILTDIDSQGLNEGFWYYLNDDGNFMLYSEKDNKKIERKFKKGRKKARIEREVIINNKTIIEKRIIIFGNNKLPHVQKKEGGVASRIVRRGLLAMINELDAQDCIWYWTDDSGEKWKPYEPEAIRQIEFYYKEFLIKKININELNSMEEEERKSIAHTNSVIVYGKSGWGYKIDYVNFVQYNESTGRWRGIRRGETGGRLRLSKIGVYNEPVPWVKIE